MPQVPSRPPPYSIECSSFPPPIQAAAGPQAWAFQRAFEAAREPVRWAILTTMRCWENDWAFKDGYVPRHLVQYAYDQAPPDMKAALDYIVEQNLPFYMQAQRDHLRHNLYRTGRIQAIETSSLSQEEFVRRYNEALDPVQNAIASTFKSWTLVEDHKLIAPVSRNEVGQAYAAASDSLKIVVSWMLETGWDIGVSTRSIFEFLKTSIHEASLNTATAHIELHAFNRLEGMY